MTDQPSTSPATRRFIIRLLVLDAIALPIFVWAYFGYRVHHIGWQLWVMLAVMLVMALAVTWLVRDLKQSQSK